MALFENFPYTNLHNLNTDWLVKVAKEFLEKYSDWEQNFDDQITEINELAQTIQNQLNAWYNTHSQDIAQQLATSLQTMQNRLTANLAAFNAESEAKGQEILNSLPPDYEEAINSLKYGIHMVYPQYVKGVSGVMTYCTVLEHKRLLNNQEGEQTTTIIVDDVTENVYLFETGLGWVYSFTDGAQTGREGMARVRKDNLEKAAYVAGYPVLNLNAIETQYYLAVNESTFHYVDLDYIHDGMPEYAERSYENIPVSFLSTANSQYGIIDSFGQLPRAFRPFRATGVINAVNATRAGIYSPTTGAYLRTETTFPFTVNDEIVVIFSDQYQDNFSSVQIIVNGGNTPSLTGAVRYDQTQELTPIQKTTAKNNIGANYDTAVTELQTAAQTAAEDITELQEDTSDLMTTLIVSGEVETVVTPTVVTGERIYMNSEHTAIGTVADANGAYLTQAVTAGEKYLFSGRFTIYISGIFFLNNNTLLSYEHYETTTENVTDYEINIPANCNKLQITYSNALQMTLKKVVDVDGRKLGSASHCWTVEPDGFGDYQTISAACAAAESGDTILVYPGEYREQININGKELHIKGVDKHTCILIDSSSDYRTPPLQANWGSISNMTIIEDASNPPAGIDDIIVDGHPVKNMAYCIHCDSGENIWTTEQTSFIVEDCILINANRPCIGAGLYPYHAVIVRNCEMTSGAGIVTGYHRGAFYAHNNQSASAVNQQEIRLENNRIQCNDTIVFILLDTDGAGTCSVELINNNVYSPVSGVASTIVENDATPSNTNFTLLASSFGNNIPSLNYSA